MALPSIMIVPGEKGIDEMVQSLAQSGGQRVDLIVLLCRDAAAARARIPEMYTGVPILALSAADFADGALEGLEAVMLNSPGVGIRPRIVRLGQKAATCLKTPDLLEGNRMIGDSPAIQEIKSSIQRIAATDSNVLITGETGTGKELIAELIQRNSRRRQQRYVCINCAAIPDSLLESELFGYERGAFTGAQMAGEGKLEGANGGTVFFDEIGDMSLYAQAKILRLIESKEIQRLGSRRPMKVDFRVIAATNLDIDSPATSPNFRRDLYFRLNVARIHMPALRERKSDIPLLIRHFIGHFNQEFGRHVEGVKEGAMAALLHHDWPGNIRELKNTVEALFVSLPTGREKLLELPERLRRQIAGTAGVPPNEQEQLLSVLWATDWNKSKAARQLQWSRMTLYRKMAKYEMERGGTKKPPQGVSGEQVRTAGNGA